MDFINVQHNLNLKTRKAIVKKNINNIHHNFHNTNRVNPFII